MSRSYYQYFICDEPSIAGDILRAAVNCNADTFVLDVYSHSDNGLLQCRSVTASRKIRSGSAVNAPIGLACGLGALFGGLVFLPLLYTNGPAAYLGLVFLCTLLAAWAGGAFMRFAIPAELRRGLSKLPAGNMFLSVYSDSSGHRVLREALARYSSVLPADSQDPDRTPVESAPPDRLGA